MPYRVYKTKGKFCLWSLNEDGSKKTNHGCHDSKDEAMNQAKTIYANTDVTAEFEVIDEDILEFGDNADLYAVAFDRNTPSTWKYPLFDAEQVMRAMDSMMYPNMTEAALTDDQKKEALRRIKDRIEKLNITESSKHMMRNRHKYLEQDMTGVSEFSSVENISIFEDTIISEFKGDFPEVPFASGVNVEELTKDDDDPVFVTLPIAEVGATSVNGLHYDERLVSEIETQINTKKPGGIFGHIKDENRDSEFPIPQALWVGTKRVGNRLWAKSYIINNEAKTYIKKLKAVGGSIATSIYGKAATITDSQNRKRAAKLNLEQLDFGSVDRVSLKLDPKMKVTSELENIKENNKKENEKMDLSTLRKEDAKALPKEVKDAIIAEFQSMSEETDRIAELESTVASKEKTIKEYEQVISGYKGREFAEKVDEKIAELSKWDTKDAKDEELVLAFRATLREAATAKLNGALDEKKLDRVLSELMENGPYKLMAEMTVKQLAGPATVTANTNAKENWREDLVKRADELAKSKGM